MPGAGPSNIPYLTQHPSGHSRKRSNSLQTNAAFSSQMAFGQHRRSASDRTSTSGSADQTHGCADRKILGTFHETSSSPSNPSLSRALPSPSRRRSTTPPPPTTPPTPNSTGKRKQQAKRRDPIIARPPVLETIIGSPTTSPPRTVFATMTPSLPAAGSLAAMAMMLADREPGESTVV